MRCIVLVGFMGAGKSTVGRLLAERLGWSFADLDDEIARREGMSVDAVIRRRGMAEFRRLESEIGENLLRGRGLVVAVGGGWAAQPGHMDGLPPDVLTIWLQVSAAAAVSRVAASSTVRPLLETSDPLATAESLLQARLRYYGQADMAADTEDGAPAEVAGGILERLGRRGIGG